MVARGLFFLFELSLTLDGQRSVLHANVDVLQFNAGDIRLQNEFILVFDDVDAGSPGTDARIAQYPGDGILEQTKSSRQVVGFKRVVFEKRWHSVVSSVKSTH